MGLRITSTIRISNASRPTPKARISREKPHRWRQSQNRYPTATPHTDMTHSAQTLRCSARHGFDFCEVYVPTGQTHEYVFFIEKHAGQALSRLSMRCGKVTIKIKIIQGFFFLFLRQQIFIIYYLSLFIEHHSLRQAQEKSAADSLYLLIDGCSEHSPIIRHQSIQPRRIRGIVGMT